MNTDYEQLDAAIVACIKQRQPCTFTTIWLAVDAEAERAVKGGGYRATDRRLQSLRKRGLIAYVKGAWRIGGDA